MINKKAQGEIITVVLIILLVLAAIVIVWQVVNSTVNRAGEQADTAAQCVGIQLNFLGTIVNTSTTQVKFKLERGTDTTGVDAFKTILTNTTGGVVVNDTMPLGLKTMENKEYVVTFTAVTPGSNTVQIAPRLGTILCDPAATRTFVA